MDPSVPLQFDAEPEAFLVQIDRILDPLILERCLDHCSSQYASDWRLVEAYLLWRLNHLARLRKYLRALPASFHDNSQYWLLLGLSYKDNPSCIDLVETSYRRALQLSPQRSDLHYNLANILSESDPFSALDLYSNSLEIDSFQPCCWHNYGRLLHQLDLPDSSFVALKISLKLDPSNASILCDLGLLYFSQEHFRSAEHAFLLAISLDPTFSEAHINLGSLLLSLCRPEDALTSFQLALDLKPDSSHALFNLGLCHLSLGRFSSGWQFYEQRLHTNLVPSSSFPSSGPLISSLAQLRNHCDGPIMIWAEQGLGDTIQFCRYLTLLLAMDIPLIFLCQQELLGFMKSWFSYPIDIFVLPASPNNVSTPHCPLLSLPRIFNTEEFSIPCSSNLFKSPDSSPRHLVIPHPPGGLAIGLVWSSNPANNRMFHKKSIPLNSLMSVLVDLLELDLIDLHSLQVGSDQSQISPWLSHPRIHDWSEKLLDFSDTAYVVQQLDLVISVDTAVAHLSASLNCPTWIMLPFDADFRWLRNRIDSPWYPNTVRLFRQCSYNDWDSVVAALRLAFNQLFSVDCQSLRSSKCIR